MFRHHVIIMGLQSIVKQTTVMLQIMRVEIICVKTVEIVQVIGNVVAYPILIIEIGFMNVIIDSIDCQINQ